MKLLTYFTTGILFCLAVTQAVHAASFTFDYNGSDPTVPPGTGTWDLSTPNWFNGSYVNWPNSLLDTAVFSGGNSANVTENVNVGTISIPSAGGTHNFTLSSGVEITLGAVGGNSISVTNGSLSTTGGALALSGSTTFSLTSGLVIGSAVKLSSYTLTVAGNTNGNSTISGVVTGTGGITKSNGGFLTLAGANTFTGDVSVTAGVLRPGVISVANVSGAFGLNTNVVLSGTGSLSLRNGTGPWYNTQIGSLAGGASNGVDLYRAVLTTGANNTDSTYAGVMTSQVEAGSGLVKVGTGTFTLTGANTYRGPTTVSAGMLLINGSLSDVNFALDVASEATLGGTGTVGRNVAIAGGGILEFDLITDAASHNKLDISPGRNFGFAGAWKLTITSSGGTPAPGLYTLVDGGNDITGVFPVEVKLPLGWTADAPVISTNKLQINITSTGGGGDVTPPTLTSIVDNVSGGPVTVGSPVAYTVTFNEDMDAASVTIADFDNQGTAAVTINSVTETALTSGIFTVVATPSSAGTLILRIAGPVLEDTSGNDLVVPVSDDTTITVQTAYDAWAGGAAFGNDENNDGVSNGLAFLLGAADPDANAQDLLPEVSENNGNLIMEFDCRTTANRGDAVLSLQFSNDLGDIDPWTTVAVPGAVGNTIDGSVSFVATDNDGLIRIVATIDESAADGGKLFGRLQAVKP